MIALHIRETVKTLYAKGEPKKAIARKLGLTIKTVRKILKETENIIRKERSDKKQIDIVLLEKLYESCSGYAERVYEILREEYSYTLGYSTLTKSLRENGISVKETIRSMQVPDEAGYEIQHDTSLYTVMLGEKKTRVICSGLYYRFSKMRYIKFYLRFNRFKMKCFMHEALVFYGYSAKFCIIDNTNLAVYSGTGGDAVFHPEMVGFAKNYGFMWKAHRIGHANRKAGKERNFYTVETNFLPGRIFKDLNDLNKQAHEWATVRWPNRFLSKKRVKPIQLWEEEKPYLKKVDENIHQPYFPHRRLIDEYGFIVLCGNYYWIPRKLETKEIVKGNVDIIEYSHIIKIYYKNTYLIKYAKAFEDIKNQKYIPQEMKGKIYEPKYIKKRSELEEKKLKAINPVVCNYLNYIKSPCCKIKQKHSFIRKLYYFNKRVSETMFLKIIERALEYQLDTMESIERICFKLLKMDSICRVENNVENYEYNSNKHNAYKQGLYSEETDLDTFQKLIEEEEE